MDEKFLNIIGKLTVEINELKDEIQEIKANAPTLDLISGLEQRIVNLETVGNNDNRITALGQSINVIVEQLNDLNKEWQENRELVIAERKRRAKLSSSLSKGVRGIKIVDNIGFGGRLRALRKDKKMFISQLATATLVPESTISYIENFTQKHIHKEYLDSLCKFLGYDFYEYVEKQNE